MKEWFQVSDLKNLIKTCDLSKVEPKDERSLIYFRSSRKSVDHFISL